MYGMGNAPMTNRYKLYSYLRFHNMIEDSFKRLSHRLKESALNVSRTLIQKRLQTMILHRF